MSDATWTVARPRDSATSIPDAVAESHASPARFNFSARCRSSGALTGLGGAVLAATGLFLLAQVSTTPIVAVQLTVVGLMLLAAGAVTLRFALRRLFGSLVLDDAGISWRPALGGFAIPWDQLERWVVKDSWPTGLGRPVVRFWAEGETLEETIPVGALTDDDAQRLREVLRRRAPEAEVKL